MNKRIDDPLPGEQWQLLSYSRQRRTGRFISKVFALGMVALTVWVWLGGGL